MDLYTLSLLLGDGLAVGAIYALTALGLTLIYGLLRVLHVAHAGVYAVGAYAGWWAYEATRHLGVALGTGALAAGLLGLFLEAWFYRPLQGKPPHVALIGSIGLFLAVGDFLRLLFGPYQKSLPALSPEPWVGPWTKPQGVVLGAAFVLLLGVYWLAERTRLGLAWRAIAQNPEVAAALGLAVPSLNRLAFLLASALAGLAGVLVAAYYNQLYPTMGAVLAYKGLAIVVLGGLGNLWGTVAASLLLGLVEAGAVAYLGNRFPPEGVAFLALILVLLFRPQGLFSRAAKG